MNVLLLEDLKELTAEQLRQHVITEYEVEAIKLSEYDILIAYESVGSWGCDSSSFFVLREKSTEKLFENHGSHCSCYGFEGQFTPQETTIEYLLSDKFYFSTGGYDDNSKKNKKSVKNYLLKLAEVAK